MKTKYMTFILLLLFSSNSYAGVIVGNGGKVVFCNTENGEAGYALDAFETSLSDQFTSSKISSIEQIMERIEAFDRSLASRLQYHIKNIERLVVEKESDLLKVFGDSVGLPEGCYIAIAMVNLLDTDTGSIQYWRNQKVWKRLDSLQQSIILLHEAVYSELIISTEPSAAGVRRTTKYLLESALGGTSLSAHLNALRAVRMIKEPRYIYNFKASEEFSFEMLLPSHSRLQEGQYLSLINDPDFANCDFELQVTAATNNGNQFAKVLKREDLLAIGMRYYWSLPSMESFEIRSLSLRLTEQGHCSGLLPLSVLLY